MDNFWRIMCFILIHIRRVLGLSISTSYHTVLLHLCLKADTREHRINFGVILSPIVFSQSWVELPWWSLFWRISFLINDWRSQSLYIVDKRSFSIGNLEILELPNSFAIVSLLDRESLLILPFSLVDWSETWLDQSTMQVKLFEIYLVMLLNAILNLVLFIRWLISHSLSFF